MVEPTPLALGLLILAALAGAALLVTAAVALPRQIDGIDPAARGGWWSDYAEHATVLALAGVLAASGGPGWWGRIGGAAALLVGLGFGVAAWRGSEREMTGTPRRALP
jgi:hypothetical protein